jgi:hypothetical protein
MAVYYAVDIGVLFEYLTMDVPFDIPFTGIRVYSAAVGDIVLYQVGTRRDERWGHVGRQKVSIWIVWMADGDVAECIDDILIMENVVGRDEGAIDLAGLC